jgi:hypothetical protein
MNPLQEVHQQVKEGGEKNKPKKTNIIVGQKGNKSKKEGEK